MTSAAHPSGRVSRDSHLIVPAALFMILVLSCIVRSPALFTGTGIAGAVLVAAPLVLATMALTPIVMAGRGAVDLAVGPLLGLINVTLIQWLVGNGIVGPVEFFAWAIGIGVVYQLFQAFVIVFVRVAPIIVTLSSYLFLSGVNLMVMPRAGGVAPDWLAKWGAGVDPFSPILAVVVVALALWGLLTRTAFHTHLRMTGLDERTAYTAGVRIEAVRFAAHVVGGVFVGLAAICHTALISSGDPIQAGTYTLQAITALVLGGASMAGGRGGAVGALLGALNMFMISRLLATFNFGMYSGYATQMSFGLILIASLLINVLVNSANAPRTR
ncbi:MULTISPECIES: ABC transporter permease [unclassified Mesorhizobium]|uniref:ABC transporter permease n=1 Tax=unclassified Mesorhizobium TaxID=325217 RepID=UPI002417840A|nr:MULTISPECIES: ABC transporter permease [unclassified Mesorhizobium]WFP65581.1 ABC transporter permease [Mesorhizobium sp. WSM4904]WFP78846.1 ABC transporter permease [Mesorhizobium sp. WSM4906]